MGKNSLFSGFIHANISQLYTTLPSFFNDMGLLITCLDSNPNPANLKAWHKKLSLAGIQVHPLGKSAWIEKDAVKAIFTRGDTFYGFDEAYLLSRRPNIQFSTKNIFTTDRLQLTGYPPKGLLENMAALDAVRYVSDGTGIGLNFICESELLMKRAFDVQPQ